MKCDTPNQWYLINNGMHTGQVVSISNADGFSHCYDVKGAFVMFCTVSHFKRIATECYKPHDLNLSSETKENNMSALTSEQQQIVNRVSQDAVNSSVDDYEVVYKTDDGFIFSSEAAVDSYNAFDYILDTVDPELLRATMAAYFEALHGN
jgi:hypothetical protein